MTYLNHLVEVGARAQMASAAYSSFWGVADHKVMVEEAILAILPLLADDLAGLLEAEKHCGCGRSDCVADNTAQNHADIIHARIAAIIEGEG